MEKIVKCPKRQDCHYKLTPGSSNETSINLSNEIFKILMPEGAPSDTAIDVTFTVYKEDYIKALCYLVGRLPLYKTASGKSSEITYSSEFFMSQCDIINNFFRQNNEALYHAKLLNRGDGRIYLNDLNDNGFNVRRFLIESNTILVFYNDNNNLTLRIETGEELYNQHSTDTTDERENEILISEQKLTTFILKCVTELSNIDQLASMAKYITGDILYDTPIKIASSEGDFALTGMFIEASEEKLTERNTPRVRWFNEQFNLKEHKVYLSTQWYGEGEYQLTLHDFINMLNTCYPGKFTYSFEGSKHTLRSSHTNKPEIALQTIFFGSPGTGKSFKIKDKILDGVDDNFIFRTTFHPDSDYSSFVGCYKPITNKNKQSNKTYTIEELADIYKREVGPTEDLKTGHIEPRIKFGIEYCEYFGGAAANYDANKMLELAGKELAAGCQEDRVGITYVKYGINIGLKMGPAKNNSSIMYDFAPQTFTNAYIKAWLNPSENVYLVIEEINRGNCAQIFGDLFQLLDRDDNGVSEYPIKADADLTKYLQEELGTDHEGISDGKIKLPANLYILATMNTSDQSLFPMDSAFKRRWEWKYVPTSVIGDKKKTLQVESKEETVLLNREQEKKVLRLGMYEYDWSVFLKKINKCITDATHSDDKQLGFWFVKTPKDSNLINIETFVSKVIFYLWTDVFKDFGAKATNPFAFKNAEGGWVVCPFSSFFDPYTGEINLGQIHGFMYNLGIIPELEPEIQAAIEKNIVEEGNPKA